MAAEKKSANSAERILIQVRAKQLEKLDNELIPLLRTESGEKTQRSEVFRVLLDIALEAIPCIDVEALGSGEELKRIFIEGIVKSSKNTKR